MVLKDRPLVLIPFPERASDVTFGNNSDGNPVQRGNGGGSKAGRAIHQADKQSAWPEWLDGDLREAIKNMSDDDLVAFNAKLARWNEQISRLLPIVFSKRPPQFFKQ